MSDFADEVHAFEGAVGDMTGAVESGAPGEVVQGLAQKVHEAMFGLVLAYRLAEDAVARKS